MTYPVAVGPGTLTPGLYLVIDLLAGAASAGVGTLKAAIIAPVWAGVSGVGAGDLGASEVRSGAGAASAAEAFGVGSPGHLAAKRLYAKSPSAQVDFVACTSAGAKAAKTWTFSGAPTQSNVVMCDVAGREWQVPWLSGESNEDIVTKIRASIAERTQDLPAITVAGLDDDELKVESKVGGAIGNDIRCRFYLELDATGTEAIDIETEEPLTGGTGVPDFATPLAVMAGEEYAFILPVIGNSDVGNVSTKSNLSKTVDHIMGFNSGLNAKLQQAVVGITSSVSAAKAAAAHANGAQNNGVVEMILCINGRGLPCELAGREIGGWLKELPLDAAVNRIGEIFDGYIGASDKVGDKPTEPESEDALGHGVSLISYTAQGLEQLVRPVTAHSQDDFGGADRRLLDVQNVSATYIVARDLRSAIPAEFPKAKVTRDIGAEDDPPPKGVIEERDIRAFVVARLRTWQANGVVTKASLDKAIADGTLIVRVNDSDESQVDLVLPFKIVPPLAKFGMVVQRQPN